MKKTYQFRIYPKKNHEVIMNRTLTTCRRLYNYSLAERKRQAELNRLRKSFDVCPWGKPEWINKYDQMLDLTATKTTYQKEVFSQVLQDVLKRVDRSFINFFKGFGYPRFQGRNRYNSFTYPQSGFELKDGNLLLSKIGSIKIILHRPIEAMASLNRWIIYSKVNIIIIILNKYYKINTDRHLEAYFYSDKKMFTSILLDKNNTFTSLGIMIYVWSDIFGGSYISRLR